MHLRGVMYKKQSQQIRLEYFFQPFNGSPNQKNRWIILSKQIAWEELETQYSIQFPSNTGPVALNFRIAFGSLIIKGRLGTSDVETLEQIGENPYLQYFLGFDKFIDHRHFDPSMMTYFRKRITSEMLSLINEKIISNGSKVKSKKKDDDDNNGKLIIDSTCTPADINYPTDIKLLSEAREKTEEIIDKLWKHSDKLFNKPRTYRRLARKAYLNIVKIKKLSISKRYKGIRKQLGYLCRNLSHIKKLKNVVSLSKFSKKQYKDLLVIGELYRQQLQLYQTRSFSIPDRIVSISQPHVRPIVRGKAGKSTEFGAKISVSVTNGFTYLDKISWDNYNESEDFKNQVEKYKTRSGYYPESVHVDKIYRTQANRKYCKKHKIRLSGLPLGRPKIVTEENHKEIQLKKKIAKKDEITRIEIEGKFGIAKRKYSLGKIMAKLAETSETAITMVFIVMNLERILKKIFCCVNNVLQIFTEWRVYIKMHLKNELVVQ